MVSIISLQQKIFVTLDEVFSYAGLIYCGVPQGSILGFFLTLCEKCSNAELFLVCIFRIWTRNNSVFGHFSHSVIYINDLPKVLNKNGAHPYANNISVIKIRILKK